MSKKPEYKTTLSKAENVKEDLSREEIRRRFREYYENEESFFQWLIENAKVLHTGRDANGKPLPAKYIELEEERPQAPKYVREIFRLNKGKDQDFLNYRTHINTLFENAKNEIEFTGYGHREAHFLDDVSWLTVAANDAFRSMPLTDEDSIHIQHTRAKSAKRWDIRRAMDELSTMESIKEDAQKMGLELSLMYYKNKHGVVTGGTLDVSGKQIKDWLKAKDIQVRYKSGVRNIVRVQGSTGDTERLSLGLLVLSSGVSDDAFIQKTNAQHKRSHSAEFSDNYHKLPFLPRHEFIVKKNKEEEIE
ncbi:hypothetical protein [Vibrio crassostreae]|uniref:hypothetical protein n=1 Tax=Vibrio crassostreae TaxID=246167 RepID=UPI001B302B91|nr:hypothetical protein [Vibrio crassostreae]